MHEPFVTGGAMPRLMGTLGKGTSPMSSTQGSPSPRCYMLTWKDWLGSVKGYLGSVPWLLMSTVGPSSSVMLANES